MTFLLSEYSRLVDSISRFRELEFRYSIQIRITTLHLTQGSHRRFLLSTLRSIIRAVHIRHCAVRRGGAVELTAREISV